MLSRPIFQRIVFLFGKPDIDLFARRLNAQVETYVLWRPQPMAKFVDAFTIEWSQFSFYTFPPCLITRCVQKIIHDQASGILVISRWTTQPFFTADRHASYSEGFSSESGSSNSGQSPSTSSTTGAAGMQIIRQSLQTRRFRQTLLKSSCSPGGRVHTNSTKCISTNDYSFVVKGHMIHCIPL